jgi:hypothetical protein
VANIALAPLSSQSPSKREYLLTIPCSYEVNYDLVVEIKSALMTFSLEIKGKAMGSVTASFK